MKSHSTTAFAPSLSEFARISDARIASDHTRAFATCRHPVSSARARPWPAPGPSESSCARMPRQAIGGRFQHGFAQASVGRRKWLLNRYFYGLQKQSAPDG